MCWKKLKEVSGILELIWEDLAVTLGCYQIDLGEHWRISCRKARKKHCETELGRTLEEPLLIPRPF